MDLLNAITLFVRVAQSGSFSATAREFGVTQSSVSKQVAQLEAHLEVRLLNRTTRRIRLTEEGESYLESAFKILDSVAEAQATVRQTSSTPSGLVRISSPTTFARQHLLPKIAVLLKRYPALQIELISSDLADNLVMHGIDVGIRFGPQSGDIVARAVGTATRVAVAAPSYLATAGPLSRADDLARHNCLLYSNPLVDNRWSFRCGGQVQRVLVNGCFSSNNAELLRTACLSGLGIALMPDWLFFDDLKHDRVHRVLNQYEPEGMPIFITYSSRRLIPTKLRVVIDFLIDEIRKDFSMSPSFEQPS